MPDLKRIIIKGDVTKADEQQIWAGGIKMGKPDGRVVEFISSEKQGRDWRRNEKNLRPTDSTRDTVLLKENADVMIWESCDTCVNWNGLIAIQCIA